MIGLLKNTLMTILRNCKIFFSESYFGVKMSGKYQLSFFKLTDLKFKIKLCLKEQSMMTIGEFGSGK